MALTPTQKTEIVYRQQNEGFDYTWTKYMSPARFQDPKLTRLVQQYLKAGKAIAEYAGDKESCQAFDRALKNSARKIPKYAQTK